MTKLKITDALGGVDSAPYSNATTSWAAAEKILPYVKGLHLQIIEFLMRHPGGCIDQHMQQDLGMKDQTQVPRRRELEDMGIVVKKRDQDGVVSRPVKDIPKTSMRPWASHPDAENMAEVWVLNPEPDEGRILKYLADKKRAKDVFVGIGTGRHERKQLMEEIKKGRGGMLVRGPKGLRIFVAPDLKILSDVVLLLDTHPEPSKAHQELVEALRDLVDRVKEILEEDSKRPGPLEQQDADADEGDGDVFDIFGDLD